MPLSTSTRAPFRATSATRSRASGASRSVLPSENCTRVSAASGAAMNAPVAPGSSCEPSPTMNERLGGLSASTPCASSGLCGQAKNAVSAIAAASARAAAAPRRRFGYARRRCLVARRCGTSRATIFARTRDIASPRVRASSSEAETSAPSSASLFISSLPRASSVRLPRARAGGPRDASRARRSASRRLSSVASPSRR